MKRINKVIAVCCLFLTTLCSYGCKDSNSYDYLPKNDNSVVNSVLSKFYDVCAIPRESGREERIRNFLASWATGHGFENVTDAVGNLLVKVPASKGMEKRPTILLQTHMDMVCVKDDKVDHDFLVDPIIPVIEGDWLKANGTSLGADDGIGIAIVLALIEDLSFNHPSLELLFTVDEEREMTGANQFAAGQLESKYYINVDNEDEGVACIGSAGGLDDKITLDLEFKTLPVGYVPFEVVVSGCLGGHSGIEIGSGHYNAIVLMAQILKGISEKADIRISELQGGDHDNAIPTTCSVKAFVNASEMENVKAVVAEFASNFAKEYGKSDPEITASINDKIELSKEGLSTNSTSRVITLLNALPNGVYSRDINGCVDTSNNLGVVKINGNLLIIESLLRSCLKSGLAEIDSVIHNKAASVGAVVAEIYSFLPWEPDYNSNLINQTKMSYEKLFGKPMEVVNVHAGLECSEIISKYPGMEAVSLGPTVKDAHSVLERVYIPSIDKTYVLIKELCSVLE